MSPVNHDPSQDETVATGRLPLTRRELRARERFLATQNQDVVPAPAYAFADVEHQPAARRPPEERNHGDQRGERSGEQHNSSAGSARGSAGDIPEDGQRGPEPVDSVPADGGASRPGADVPPEPALPPVVHEDTPEEQSAHEEPAVQDTPEPQADPASDPDPIPAIDGTRVLPAIRPNEEPSPAIVEAMEPAEPGFHDILHPSAQVTAHPEADHAAPESFGDDSAQYADSVHYEQDHTDDAQDGHYAHQDGLHYDDHGHEYVEHDNHVMIGSEAVPTSPKPSKKVRRRRRFFALLLTLAVFVAAIAVGAQFLKPLLGMDKVTDYPGPGTGSVTVTVQPGAGPKLVASKLEEQKVVANADSFLKEFLAAGGELSPGDFQFRKEMKNSDAVSVLLNRDSSKVMYFALSAGLRIGESLDAIAKGSGIPLEQLKALSDSPGQFGVPSKAKNLEGFLSPGEYRFPLGTPAKDILQKLVTTTLDELKAQGITDPAKQYDTITVASIVQAEGGQADYGNVAGAIYNRLKPNNTETSGLIQSDATVTYGLGRKSFHINEAEKADKSNPYNTYANPGLPAGPIGSPGKTAIDAAAKPTTNDYLYWVTINLDTKETKFSKTLAEHSRYVEQYNAWCGANPGRCV